MENIYSVIVIWSCVSCVPVGANVGQKTKNVKKNTVLAFLRKYMNCRTLCCDVNCSHDTGKCKILRH